MFASYRVVFEQSAGYYNNALELAGYSQKKIEYKSRRNEDDSILYNSRVNNENNKENIIGYNIPDQVRRVNPQIRKMLKLT